MTTSRARAPHAYCRVPSGGRQPRTRRGQPRAAPGDDQPASARPGAALTGPPTAALTVPGYRPGPRVSGPTSARQQRGGQQWAGRRRARGTHLARSSRAAAAREARPRASSMGVARQRGQPLTQRRRPPCAAGGVADAIALRAAPLDSRKQLALYQEHHVTPRRATDVTRFALVWLSQWFDWQQARTVVHPETFRRWRRQRLQRFWRWASCPGRPPIPVRAASAHPSDGTRQSHVGPAAHRQ